MGKYIMDYTHRQICAPRWHVGLGSAGLELSTLGADVSPFNHMLFKKVTRGCFFHGDLWKTKQASGVSGSGLGCESTANARQSLTAPPQPTLNLALDLQW